MGELGIARKTICRALLPLLAQLATQREDIITVGKFRDILTDMSLLFEKTKPAP